jgi:hypothetical protein
MLEQQGASSFFSLEPEPYNYLIYGFHTVLAGTA